MIKVFFSFSSFRYIREDAASEMGRREIRFVTGGNPADFWEYSAMW